MLTLTSNNFSTILSNGRHLQQHTYPFCLVYGCLPSLPTIVQLDRGYQTYWDGNDDEFSISKIKDSFLFFYIAPPIVNSFYYRYLCSILNLQNSQPTKTKHIYIYIYTGGCDRKSATITTRSAMRILLMNINLNKECEC